MLLAGTQIPLKRQEPVTSQLTPGIGPVVTQRIGLIYSKNSPKRLAYWVSLFSKYNSHGKGPEHLQQANYIFQSQPKELRFLRAVSAKESPKEMGLKGIHDPEALRHFSGYTYCPWCGKSGQNEGTIVNHLRTTHKLGLICNRCFGCPTTMSDTLCRHGHINCTD